MTTMYTNNPPTSRHLNAAHRTTTSAKHSTPGVQKQNTPALLTLDEKADQLLKMTSLTVDEAREVANALEKLLDLQCQITLNTRRRCFRGLVRLCGEYGVLPESYIIPEDKIEKLGDAPVATGGFSEVWPGMYEEEKAVAIKIIKYYTAEGLQTINKSFCREVITLKRLSHPNILELTGVMMDNGLYAMVTPWMQNGNIVDYVREEPQINPLELLEGATLGLQYLHSMDLAHGDLKESNILISEDGHACLTDVGTTRVAGDMSSATATTQTSTTEGGLTVRWSPPEMLDPERFGAKRSRPTKKSDVYSMAMTIYQVLTDRVPYYDCGELPAMLRIIQGVRPSKPIFLITRGYTEDLWELTTRCWDEKPLKRPVVEEILEVLKAAAKQWKPTPFLPPQDDPSPTLDADESSSRTLFEPVDEHASTDLSLLLDPRHSPTINTLVTTTSLYSSDSEMSPAHTPDTSDEEKVTTAPINLSQEDPRRDPALKEVSKHTIVPRPTQEDLKSTHAARKEETEASSVRPSGGEKPGRPAGVGRISVAFEDTQQVPASMSETQLDKQTPATLGKDDMRKTAPVKSYPVTPKLASTTSHKVSPGPTPANFSDQNQTSAAIKPGLTCSSESEDERIAAKVSCSFDPPRSSVTKPPVSASSVPIPSLPPSLPSTIEITPAPKPFPTTSREKQLNPVVPRPPGEDRSRPTPTIEKEEEMRSGSVRSSRGEKHKQTSPASRKEETTVVPVVPSREKESKSTSAISTNEKAQHASPSPSTLLEPPREANPQSRSTRRQETKSRSTKEALSEPTTATFLKKQEAEPLANSSTRAEVQSRHTSKQEVPGPLVSPHSR